MDEARAAVESESLAFPHLSALLASLSPASGPSTRSKTAAPPPVELDDEAQLKIEATPIPELTVDGGMDDEMIWEQMELRGKTVDGLMEAMFGQKDDEDEEGASGEEGFDEDDEDEEGFEGLADGGESDEEDGEEEEEDDDEIDFDDLPEAAKEEYFRKLGGGDEDEDEGEDDEGEDGEDDDAEDGPAQGADPLADESSGLTLDNFDGESGSKSKSRRSK